MASASQHRCVFVGNIPYDATEEQLIDICREVGPVVSFRLVIDRETGKPKGYGFCEYKDEETALSARRNLQGYEINGRQLRVDFAENDKNADRNREQGRGGPGMATNVDPMKQAVGPTIPGESAQHQPIGLHIAMTAATVMAGALRGAQTSMQSGQNGIQGQSALASDPLTLYLAKMSRSQLNEIMFQLKVMATQHREGARQLLLARPQLSKALFQAQIMLGMVTPQVLQMPNIQQPPGQSSMASLHDAQQGQKPAVQTLPRLPPQNSLVHNRFSAPQQLPMQPHAHIPQYANNHVPQQAVLPAQSGVPLLPPLHPSTRPQIPVTNSSSLNQQMQPLSLQFRGQLGTENVGHNSQMALPNMAIPCPAASDTSLQPGPPTSSGISDAVSRNVALNMQASMIHDLKEPNNRPSKLLKLDDGRSIPLSAGGLNTSYATRSGPSQASAVGSVPANSLPKVEELPHTEKKGSQLQLPPDVESVLLRQVLNLTPEQLSSLPPEQQQQVINLQQALQQDQLQLS